MCWSLSPTWLPPSVLLAIVETPCPSDKKSISQHTFPFPPVESPEALSKALICGMKSPLVKVALKPEATDVMMQLSVSSSGEQVPTGRSGPGP